MVATISQKENGFIVEAVDGENPARIFVVEGKDPKKIGQAILTAFSKPRAPYKKKSGAAA